MTAVIYLWTKSQPQTNTTTNPLLSPTLNANSSASPATTQTSHDATAAALSGTIVDSKDRPIQGANVTLDELPGMKPAETSSDGVFSINDIPRKYGEAVRIRVVKEGYAPNPYTEDVVLGKAPPRVRLERKK